MCLALTPAWNTSSRIRRRRRRESGRPLPAGRPGGFERIEGGYRSVGVRRRPRRTARGSSPRAARAAHGRVGRGARPALADETFNAHSYARPHPVLRLRLDRSPGARPASDRGRRPCAATAPRGEPASRRNSRTAPLCSLRTCLFNFLSSPFGVFSVSFEPIVCASRRGSSVSGAVMITSASGSDASTLFRGGEARQASSVLTVKARRRAPPAAPRRRGGLDERRDERRRGAAVRVGNREGHGLDGQRRRARDQRRAPH